MKFLKGFLVGLVILLVASSGWSADLTASEEKVWDHAARGVPGYFKVYQVTLTQVDADPSNDSYTIPDRIFHKFRGGVLYAISVNSSTADADIGITITDSASVEWFDEEFAQASLPVTKNGNTTYGDDWPPLSTDSITIGTDTDWTTAASGDSITITMYILTRQP